MNTSDTEHADACCRRGRRPRSWITCNDLFSLRRQSTGRSGFTLIEMLVVILIICILVASTVGIYQQARNSAWKQRARDTARQIATAWNIYLIDNHAYPATTSFQGYGAVYSGTFQTIATNMSVLNSSKIYLEQSADQRINDGNHGMMDKWGNFFYVRLDQTYTGTLQSPVDGSTINANVVVWSQGPNPSNPGSSFCLAWQ